MAKIKNIDEKELYELYIIKNLNISEISKLLNVSISCISKKLNKYNIKKDKKKINSNFKNTMKKRYGNNCFSQSEETIKKRKETCIEKYGVENPSQNNNVKEKRKKTCLKKYGTENYLSSEISKQKRVETCLKKYGVDNISKLEYIKEKKKRTFIDNYGVENIFQLDSTKKKIKQTYINKYGVDNPMKNLEVKYRLSEKVKTKYGVPYYCMTKKCRDASGVTISKINKDISNLLISNNINNELEFNIENKSYDIHVLNTNIVLEINPTYTHNSTNDRWFKGYTKNPLEKNYHYNKTLVAKKNGYRCIHIWDWDDINKIINILKPKEKIYARGCEIVEVLEKDCNIFLNNNHVQGSCKGQVIRLGLYCLGELVEIMTFGKPRYNNKYEYELLRLCSNNNYIIVGGTEKLFNYFLEKYNPKSIISYCDNSKFDGEVYNRLGFKLENYGNPSKHWYNMKTKKHITDNLLRQRGFDQLFNTNYGKGTSNEELMKENEFVEIYDSGQSTYIYKNQD